MNKAYIALLLVLTFASVHCNYYETYGDAYEDIYKYGKGSFAQHSGKDIACANAVAGFNRAISQLFIDISAQSNQWVIYADLDALDEVSYYVKHSCKHQALELDSIQENGQTEAQSKACSQLFGIVGSILEQNETQTFRGGYEKGIDLSNAALNAGKDLGDGCKVKLSPVQKLKTQPEAAANNNEANTESAEEEWNLSEENNEEAGEAEAEYLLDAAGELSYDILKAETSSDEDDDDWEDDEDNDDDNNDDDDDDDDDDDNDNDNDDDNDSDNDNDNDDDDNQDESDNDNDNDNDDNQDESDNDNDNDSDNDNDNDDSEDDKDNNDNNGNDYYHGDFSWNDGTSNQGIHIRIGAGSKNGKNKYEISYNPNNKDNQGSEAGYQTEEANAEESNNEEWSNEEGNNEEWANEESTTSLETRKDYFSFITGLYQWQNGDYQDYSHNYNGGKRIVMSF